MPVIFGTTILTITFNGTTGKLVLTGQAFGINQYAGVSDIQYRRQGDAAWSSVNSVDLWGDEMAEGTITALPLAGGNYDVRVVSSDGEVSDTYVSAFVIVAGSASQVSHRFGIGGMGF